MTTFARFRPFLKPYLSRMVLAGLLVMAVATINLALLRLAGLLWDVITVQHDAGRMNRLIALFLGLVIIQGLCSMGHSYFTATVSQHIVADFRRHLFAHLQTLSLGFFARRRTGELLSRLMNDVTIIQSVVTETPIDAAKQLVTFVGGVAFLLAMNWQLCLLILILLPLLVFVAKFFGRRLKSLSTSIQDQTAGQCRSRKRGIHHPGTLRKRSHAIAKAMPSRRSTAGRLSEAGSRRPAPKRMATVAEKLSLARTAIGISRR